MSSPGLKRPFVSRHSLQAMTTAPILAVTLVTSPRGLHLASDSFQTPVSASGSLLLSPPKLLPFPNLPLPDRGRRHYPTLSNPAGYYLNRCVASPDSSARSSHPTSHSPNSYQYHDYPAPPAPSDPPKYAAWTPRQTNNSTSPARSSF